MLHECSCAPAVVRGRGYEMLCLGFRLARRFRFPLSQRLHLQRSMQAAGIGCSPLWVSGSGRGPMMTSEVGPEMRHVNHLTGGRGATADRGQPQPIAIPDFFTNLTSSTESRLQGSPRGSGVPPAALRGGPVRSLRCTRSPRGPLRAPL